MAPRSIIDSHIHLWPEETANEDGHTWMTPDAPLAKPHILSDYCRESNHPGSTETDHKVEGVVFIETDVQYDPPTGDLEKWAQGPLNEIRFVRQIIESAAKGPKERDLLLGLVPWVPIDQPTTTVEQYLSLAEEAAGPEAWKRVKGFRFLLQAITDESEFTALVTRDDFINNLKLLGRRGFSFDIGVDQHSAGVWQLDAIVAAMRKAQQGVDEDERKPAFVINHLCKPDFAADEPGFRRWCDAIAAMAALPKTYMKLSGAFSELPSEPAEASAIAKSIGRWVSHVLEHFGPQRVMFGSDWPVCNVGQPREEGAWTLWKDVVEFILSGGGGVVGGGFSAQEKDRIWRGTAKEAYGLE